MIKMKKAFILAENDAKKCRLGETQQSVAFTLAEVLITLAIIGVIAAITIPNLMQNYIKSERITQIKTARSILSNAVRLSVAENGSTDGWVYTDKTDLSEKYILPYLKIQKNCGVTTSTKGCIKHGCPYALNGDGVYCGYWYNITLQNGMNVSMMPDTIVNNVFVRFAVDVNGQKGKAKLGSDVFVFRLEIPTGKLVTDGGTSNYSKKEDIMTKATNGGCNSASLSAVLPGFACARVLEVNGWQFPDDYPVKKF